MHLRVFLWFRGSQDFKALTTLGPAGVCLVLSRVVSISGMSKHGNGPNSFRTESEDPQEAPVRTAASSYLNSVPLIWSFTNGTRQHEVELITDTAPARCAELLANREVEAALVPVIEYQRIADLAIVPGVCVGSRSSVRSVVLVMREGLDDLRKVRTVALDISSRTSAALIQIIFREFVGVEPEWTERAPDVTAMLKTADAALVIGDPGMTFWRSQIVVYDLAELWRRYTDLGFVFAMWMARERDV